MVNPGAPRAGCDVCRIAKKGCTLERPSCARCVRLGKTCTGYRNTSQLQLRDETEAIYLKYSQSLGPAAILVNPGRSALTHVDRCRTAISKLQRESNCEGRDSGAQEGHQAVQVANDLGTRKSRERDGLQVNLPFDYSWDSVHGPYAFSIDRIATPHILESLGLRKRWGFLSTYNFEATQAPCLDLAARACGVAALLNVKEEDTCPPALTRSRYVAAVAEVNKALRDPQQCLTDEVLIAILLLGYYETLTKDHGSAGLTTFKAHIFGATELLRLRGLSQFTSVIGRQIFRQLRYQILLLALWIKQDIPDFLHEWSGYCRAASTDALDRAYDPGDDLADIICKIITTRTEICRQGICDRTAAELYAKIDHQLAAWASGTIAEHASWRYQEVRTHTESPHIWSGICHVYSEGPASLVWNTYRGVRIMVARLRKRLLSAHHAVRDLAIFDDARQHLSSLQRQMANEICAAIPTNLGHTPEGTYKCQSVLLGSSSSIWPLFMAGVAVLDQIETEQSPNPMIMTTSTAQHKTGLFGCSTIMAQEIWIQGRLELIKDQFGLHWAGAMATMLRRDRAKIELWFT